MIFWILLAALVVEVVLLVRLGRRSGVEAFILALILLPLTGLALGLYHYQETSLSLQVSPRTYVFEWLKDLSDVESGPQVMLTAYNSGFLSYYVDDIRISVTVNDLLICETTVAAFTVESEQRLALVVSLPLPDASKLQSLRSLLIGTEARVRTEYAARTRFGVEQSLVTVQSENTYFLDQGRVVLSDAYWAYDSGDRITTDVRLGEQTHPTLLLYNPGRATAAATIRVTVFSDSWLGFDPVIETYTRVLQLGSLGKTQLSFLFVPLSQIPHYFAVTIDDSEADSQVLGSHPSLRVMVSAAGELVAKVGSVFIQTGFIIFIFGAIYVLVKRERKPVRRRILPVPKSREEELRSRMSSDFCRHMNEHMRRYAIGNSLFLGENTEIMALIAAMMPQTSRVSLMPGVSDLSVYEKDSATLNCRDKMVFLQGISLEALGEQVFDFIYFDSWQPALDLFKTDRNLLLFMLNAQQRYTERDADSLRTLVQCQDHLSEKGAILFVLRSEWVDGLYRGLTVKDISKHYLVRDLDEGHAVPDSERLYGQTDREFMTLHLLLRKNRGQRTMRVGEKKESESRLAEVWEIDETGQEVERIRERVDEWIGKIGRRLRGE